MRAAGFVVFGEHLPNCPVFIGDHRKAQVVAQALFDEGILVQPLFAPYVPNNRAIIRVNMNAHHTIEDIERCVAIFSQIGKQHHLTDKCHHQQIEQLAKH